MTDNTVYVIDLKLLSLYEAQTKLKDAAVSLSNSKACAEDKATLEETYLQAYCIYTTIKYSFICNDNTNTLLTRLCELLNRFNCQNC